MKQPSKRLVRQLAKRLISIGMPEDMIDDGRIGALACGCAMLIVRRGPDLCNCCSKPVLRATLVHKTKIPLEELFKP